MKKSLSQFNLLQKKLSGNQKGFFTSLFSGKKLITIKVPYYEYLRANIFIDDLRENFHEEIPFNFNVGSLINILYKDFLYQIRNGTNNQEIAQFLIRGKKEYFSVQKKEKRVMKAVSVRLLEFHSYEEESSLPQNRTSYIELRMEEKEILRGEILLHDLEEYLQDIPVTFEDILIIRFLDFVQDIKNQGSPLSLQKSIVKRISS